VSVVYLDNHLVHYEVFGRGQPIIFLHSWVGSWRYWVPIMDIVSERYRAYALDFWGFGDSDRKYGVFTLDEYERMLVAFMDEIGIQKANLVGHGMGGMVAIRAAKSMPERFPRLVVVSTPLRGETLHEPAKSSGAGALSRMLRGGPSSNRFRAAWQVPLEDKDARQEILDDTDTLTEDVIQSIEDSIVATNLEPILKELHNTPILAVYGEKDTITPPDHSTGFFEGEPANGRPQQLITLPQTSHFPFLEEATTFSRLLLDFLVSEGTPVEIKEQWRRRVSQRDYL
jgi:pimeloyl-ACP methyl ester carboxylesterase